MNTITETMTKGEAREVRAYLNWAKRNGKMPAAEGLHERIAAMNHAPLKEVR